MASSTTLSFKDKAKGLWNKDIAKRVLFTLVVLLIYKIGLSVTVPNVKVSDLTGALQDSSWLSLISLIGGGGLESFSIFSLGVTPYITASFIVQMLGMDVIPYFTELTKQGNVGRKKMDQITRYMAVVFAFVQSLSLIYMMNKNYTGLISGADSASQMAYIALVFTAGSFILIWLGDQMSMKGIGNGLSMLIAAGIVGRLPQQVIGSFQSLCGKSATVDNGMWIFVGYIVAYLLIIVLVTLIYTAERKIPIQYTSSSVALSHLKTAIYLPLKVNSASVMPVIFASSIMLAPLQIMTFFMGAEKLSKVSNWLGMKTWYSLVIYVLLILFFTFFYTKMQINPEKVAENLGKSGSYIPSVRPGSETKDYINRVLSRITVFGSVALAFIAVMPHVMPLIWPDLPSSMALGGTGMIIVVGVAIETVRQVQGLITQKSYKKYYED